MPRTLPGDRIDMTPRLLAILAVRLLAMFFIVRSLDAFIALGPAFFYSYQSFRYQSFGGSPVISLVFTVLGPLVQVAIAVYLWRRAGVVASWMLGHSLHDDQFEPGASQERLDLAVLQRVALSTLGAWVVVSTVDTRLFGEILGDRVTLDQIAFVVLRFLAGVWLLFGAAGIQRAIGPFTVPAARAADATPAPPPNDDDTPRQ